MIDLVVWLNSVEFLHHNWPNNGIKHSSNANEAIGSDWTTK